MSSSNESLFIIDIDVAVNRNDLGDYVYLQRELTGAKAKTFALTTR
jgi:hypothetical protein